MKVLFFIGKLYGGGAERVAANILNHLCEHHNVIAAIANDTRNKYPLSSKITIKKFAYKGTKNAYRIISNSLKIRNIIKESNPDLIISFIVDLNGCVLLANGFINRRKIIVSERTTIQRKQSFWQILTRRILYRHATKIVFVSESDYCYAKWLKNKTFIYNPLNIAKLSGNQIRDNSIVAIGPQRRWHVKGFDLLIQAWGKIAKSYPDWKLQFVGENNDNYINNLVKTLNLENQVDFLGWTDEIDKTLRTKCIYVLSSRNEGFPNSLIEAMSQGCACVAFDCKTGPNEIITDGVSGLLARNGDADDLATKLQLLIENKDLLQQMSICAKEEVKRFDKELIMKQWDELIHLAIE